MSFGFISTKKQFLKSQRQIESVINRQNNVETVNSIAFVSLAEKGDIDEVTATEHIELFVHWTSNIHYVAGALRQHKGDLYRCIQEHTSQDDWEPDAAVSLWTKVGNPFEEYPEWSQPISALDAYNTGAKTTRNGKRWISTIDGNVWEPGVYGWNEV